jgi:hypothetical protein
MCRHLPSPEGEMAGHQKATPKPNQPIADYQLLKKTSLLSGFYAKKGLGSLQAILRSKWWFLHFSQKSVMRSQLAFTGLNGLLSAGLKFTPKLGVSKRHYVFTNSPQGQSISISTSERANMDG